MSFARLHGFWYAGGGNLLPLMEVFETSFSEPVILFVLIKKQALWCLLNLTGIKRRVLGKGGRREHYAKELYVNTVR